MHSFRVSSRIKLWGGRRSVLGVGMWTCLAQPQGSRGIPPEKICKCMHSFPIHLFLPSYFDLHLFGREAPLTGWNPEYISSHCSYVWSIPLAHPTILSSLSVKIGFVVEPRSLYEASKGPHKEDWTRSLNQCHPQQLRERYTKPVPICLWVITPMVDDNVARSHFTN